MTPNEVLKEVRARGYVCSERTIQRKLALYGVRHGGHARARRYDPTEAMAMVDEVFPVIGKAPAPRRKRGKLLTVAEAMQKGGRA